MSVRAKHMLNLLESVHKGVEGGINSERVELKLNIIANQARTYPGLRSALASMASRVTQLRVVQSLPDFIDNQFLLSGLKVIGFAVPSDAHKISHYQQALQSATSVEALQMYAASQAGADLVPQFLQVLQSLPNVTHLTIATSFKQCCIPASSLQHMTSLDLGIDVSTSALPVKLAHLCLEGSVNVTGPYVDMFKQSDAMGMPLSISLHSMQPVTSYTFMLQDLPQTLHTLALLQLIAQHQDLLHTALSQLSHLKVLQLGDFLTKDVVSVVTGLRLPQLRLDFVYIAVMQNTLHTR